VHHKCHNTQKPKSSRAAEHLGNAGCDGVLQWQLLGVDDEPRCSQVLSAFTVLASWHRRGRRKGEGDAVKGQCFDCPVEDKGERRQTLLMSGHELNTSIKREHVCWPGL